MSFREPLLIHIAHPAKVDVFPLNELIQVPGPHPAGADQADTELSRCGIGGRLASHPQGSRSDRSLQELATKLSHCRFSRIDAANSFYAFRNEFDSYQA
jgi:hypothetical protein